MAFRNMKAEMKREGVTQVQVAESMDMSTNNLNLKINEKIPMTVDEAKFIQERWLPEVTLDTLLESDGDKPTKSESLHAQADAIGDILRQAEPDDEEGIANVEGAFHELADEYARRYPEESVEEVS